jgi:hypothetical protein
VVGDEHGGAHNAQTMTIAAQWWEKFRRRDRVEGDVILELQVVGSHRVTSHMETAHNIPIVMWSAYWWQGWFLGSPPWPLGNKERKYVHPTLLNGCLQNQSGRHTVTHSLINWIHSLDVIQNTMWTYLQWCPTKALERIRLAHQDSQKYNELHT